MKIRSFVIAAMALVIVVACSKDDENNLAPKTGAYTVTGDTSYTINGAAAVTFVGDTLAGVVITSTNGVTLAVNIKGANVKGKGSYSVKNNGTTLNGQSNTNLQDGTSTAYSGTGGTIRTDNGSVSDFHGEIRNMTMENFTGGAITVNGSFRASSN